jgi:hypothetical protein
MPVAYGVEMANGGIGYVGNIFFKVGAQAKGFTLNWSKFDKTLSAWR